MIPDEIQSTRLHLRRITTEQLKSVAAGGLLESHLFEHGWLEDREDLRESAEHCHESDWWLPYLVGSPESERIIGVILFKGPPDLSDTVEIAYSIAPAWRCQGYAREVVRAILEAVRKVSGIRRICAYTFPEMNASSRVLAHCGFERTRVVEDIDLGPLWRWETSSLCSGPEK
jgi:RimJ/RimL family protein N-acetyltransferase